jgi:hypothetical protein
MEEVGGGASLHVAVVLLEVLQEKADDVVVEILSACSDFRFTLLMVETWSGERRNAFN